MFLAKNLSVLEQVSRINKALRTVADQCAGPVEDTLLSQAALVASEQRSLAAVSSDADNAGALRDSIRVERGSPTAKHAIVIKIKAGGATTTRKGVGKPYDYARAVEFGTKDMQAEPFFYPIWRARKKEVRAAVRKAIALAVPKVFK